MSAARTIPFEQYQKLPEDQRSRPLTDEEYKRLSPEQLRSAGLADDDEGAPADFNGPVFPNPDHIQVHDDSESNIPVTRLPRGVTFNRGLYHGDAHSDLSNPAAADISPAAMREMGAKMSAAPTIDFSKYEKAAPGKIDFSKYEKPAAATTEKKEEPGVIDRALDKEIPLSGPWYNPTLSGLQSIGRGVRGAVEGGYQTLRHPIDTATGMARSIGEIPSTLKEIPGAIRDINASPDPLGHYAKAAQETAGQGAGQALVALGTEGLIKGAPAIARVAKPAVASAARFASDAVDPDLVGIASPRLAHAQKLAGRVADTLEKKPGIARPEIDLTGTNKPFAGGLDEPKPGKVLDATGENKPFAGGMDEYAEPKARLETPETKLGNSGTVPSPSETAQQIRYFRSRNIGEEGIPYRSESPAQASASQSEVENRIAPYRADLEGKPQEVITGDLSQTPGFSVHARSNGPSWYKFHGDVPESAVTRIAKPVETSARPIAEPGAETPTDPLLARLQEHANNIQAEEGARVPEEDEDLTDLLTKSVAQAKAARGLPAQ